MAYKQFGEMALYQAIQDLAVWLVPHVGKWDKWVRPTLGQQALDCLMNLFRAATTAYGAPKGRKLPHLEHASAELDGLRMLLQLSVTLHLTSRGQYEHASRLVGETGKQLGGWMGAVRQGEGG
jgi:hypothetical protein